MSNLTSPTAAWQSFRERVYGKAPLTEGQERECSRAFYAGMMETWFVFVKDITSIEDEDIASDAVEFYGKEIAAAAKRTLKCDGDHAEPPCEDPECWLK